MLALAAAARTARAASCEGAGEPVVLVAFTGPRWSPSLREGVIEHLRAGLGPNGFRVCDVADGSAKSVATVELRQNAGEHVTATIEVRDGVTEKRVARDIDLSALPEDARALGVGVAADELLRASWVELSLEGAPQPAAPPPHAVVRAVATSLRSTPRRPTLLSARGTAEGYTGGLVLFGGDVAFAQALGSVVVAGIWLGVRQSATEITPHGSVSATLFGAGASCAAKLATFGPFSVAAEASVWAANARVRGHAAGGALGREASGVAVVARAGLDLGAPVAGPVFVELRGGAGLPLSAVAARDYGTTVTGVRGFEWYASLGPGVAF